MKKEPLIIKTINSVSELHRILSLPKPSHPLITLINHCDVVTIKTENKERLLLNFYNGLNPVSAIAD